LNATTPSYGTASWSLVSGNVTIVSPSSNTSIVTGLTNTATLRWQTKNGVCPPNYKDIVVTRDLPPDQAIVGLDFKTNSTEVQLTANTPSAGTGYWSVVEGGGIIESVNSPTTMVTSLSDGNNVFRWTIKSGTCRESSDDITVFIQPFEIPNAFSPNDDNINDEFVILGIERYLSVALSVYNRWGSLVYYDPQYKNSWRGTNMNNEKLSDDTYYYTLEIPGKKNYNGFLILKQK
jgi:gliding motility-associated-like protein